MPTFNPPIAPSLTLHEDVSLRGVADENAFVDTRLPSVSLLIPCRNEERYIARCLDSVLANDYPRESLEVLVIDGQSIDRTVEIVKDYCRRFKYIRLVDNPMRSIPAAMNRGTEIAQGEFIIKIDAHSLYRPNHIRACVTYQQRYGAQNVGGMLEIRPGAATPVARAIVLVLGSKFGSGNALVKTRVDRPTWSDSVAFGCFRRSYLKDIGGFNENLTGSSDLDLNRRIQAAGGSILLVPEVIVDYFADASLSILWRHNFADGVWATYVLKFGSNAWSWRHWAPLALVSILLLCGGLGLAFSRWLSGFYLVAGAYLVAGIVESCRLAIRDRSVKMMMLLPLTFAVRHMAHGLGAMYGFLLLIVPGYHWKGRRSAGG